MKVTIEKIASLTTIKELIEGVPEKAFCADKYSFEELQRRFKEAGLSFTVNVENYEVRS
jgi:hypothetical protein